MLKTLLPLLKTKSLIAAGSMFVVAGTLVWMNRGNDTPNKPAQTPATQSESNAIAGRWNLRYYDRFLGSVHGTAFIEKDEKKGRLLLEYPKGERKEQAQIYGHEYDAHYTLDITNIKRSGNRITLDVEGDWPGAHFGSAYELGDPIGRQYGGSKAGEQGAERFENAKLSITIDGKKEQLEFSSGDTSAEKDVTHVTLYSHGISMDGRWEYQAGGALGREADNNGRIYKIERNDDGDIRAYGFENWWRPEPVVELVAPLPHLSKYNDHPANGGEDYRRIIVIGRDLPHPEYEHVKRIAIETVPSDTKIIYSIERAGDDKLKHALPALANQLSQSDYKRIKSGLQGGELEALMLTASLPNDAQPGLTHLKLDDGINQIEVAWMLTFDDYFADMQFARKVLEGSQLAPFDEPAPSKREGESHQSFSQRLQAWSQRKNAASRDVYEPTADIYAADALYLVINTKVKLPYERIPLIIGHGEKILRFNGGKELIAMRDPEDARRYVAGPFVLPIKNQSLEFIDALGQQALVADTLLPRNARISVRVHQTHESLPKKHWLFKPNSPIISAQVVLSPQDVLIGNAANSSKLFTTWQSAYEAVRNCYPERKASQARYSTIDDPYLGSSLHVDSYTHYILNNIFQGKAITRSTNILMGDHAAMLLLRDTYLAMMYRQRDEMQHALKHPYQFYQLMRPHSHLGDVPFDRAASIMRQTVTLPDQEGTEVPLYEAYYSHKPGWYDAFDLFGIALKDYLSDIATQALNKQIADIDTNIALVQKADRCDKTQLIEKTQKYFRVAAPQSFKKLYRQTTAASPYTADTIARAWVQGLYWLAENQKTEGELNKADNMMLASEVALVGAIPAVLGTASSMSAAGLAYLAGESTTVATASLAAESAFSMGGLWAGIIATVETVDLGYTAYNTISELSEYHQDLAFARTSQSILGYHQYKRLEDQRMGKYAWAGFDAVLGAIGAYGTGQAITHAGHSLKSMEHFSDLMHKAFIGDAAALYARRGTLVQDSIQWGSHSLERARELGGKIYANMRRKAIEFVNPPLHGPKRVVPSVKSQKAIVEMTRKLMKHNGVNVSKFSDEALMEMAQRLGTEIFTGAAHSDMPARMAHRRAAYAMMDEITNTQRNAERLASAFELERNTQRGRQYLKRIYDELQKMPRSERELFAEWMRQFADSHGDILRNQMINRRAAEAIMVFKYLEDVQFDRMMAQWADHLSTRSFEKVRRMNPSLREPLKALVQENPQRFTNLLSDEVGERVLRGNAFENLDQYEQAIAKEKKRIRNANPAGWEEIGGKPPKGLYLDEHVGKVLPNGSQKASIDVSTNWWWGRKENRFAKFERRVDQLQNLSPTELGRLDDFGLPTQGKMFTFVSAKIDDLQVPQSVRFARDEALNELNRARKYSNNPDVWRAAIDAYDEAQDAFDKAMEHVASIRKRTMISNMKNPMIAGKGTPLAAYLNQRIMHKLGIDYADDALKIVKLQEVVNKKSALQLHWLQKTYGDTMPINEMLSHLDSYRYAESALNQAGFKITDAKLFSKNAYTEIAGTVSQFAADTNSHSFGGEGLKGFLKRFSSINPSDKVSVGFDIYLQVAPM